MPKISVIMPIYNTKEKYLRQAIKSILKQTFRDFEFLILNDSPENIDLDKIVKSYHDSRIRYVKPKKNLGISESHNYMLTLAKGKYIAIMDHDDISLPTRLEEQFNYMEKHPQTGILGCSYRRFGCVWKKRVIHNPVSHKDIQALLFFKCPILHPSAFIRKNILDKYHIKYERQFVSLNDRQLYFDISHYARLHNLEKVLYKYRIYSQMTSKMHRQKIMNEQQLYRDKFLKKYNIHLTKNEHQVMNDYLLNGRCKIKTEQILKGISALLQKFINENKKKHFADEKAFQNICCNYLIKRCKNACYWGFVSSYEILKENHIVKGIPLWLRLFNRIKRRNV